MWVSSVAVLYVQKKKNFILITTEIYHVNVSLCELYLRNYLEKKNMVSKKY